MLLAVPAQAAARPVPCSPIAQPCSHHSRHATLQAMAAQPAGRQDLGPATSAALQQLWRSAVRLAAPVATALALLLQPCSAKELTLKFKASPDPAFRAAQTTLVEAWGAARVLRPVCAVLGAPA